VKPADTDGPHGFIGAAIGDLDEIRRDVAAVDLSALAEAVTALEIALEIEQPLGDLHAAHPSEYAVPSAEVEGELKALADAVGVPAPKAVRS